MTRTGALVLTVMFLGACTTTPSITRTKTTLGQVDMEGLECRRDRQAGSNIGRTICASPESWANYENVEAAKSQAMLDDIDENTDNRRLYPGMRAD